MTDLQLLATFLVSNALCGGIGYALGHFRGYREGAIRCFQITKQVIEEKLR